MVQFDYKPQWERELRLAKQSLSVGETKTISKWQVESELPKRFDRSWLSLHNGAKAVYRDQSAEYSLQIRKYDEKWEVQLDRHHPKYNAIGHLVKDAPQVGAALAVCGGFYLLSR